MLGTALAEVSGGVQWYLCCILVAAAEFHPVFLSIPLFHLGHESLKRSLRRNSES